MATGFEDITNEFLPFFFFKKSNFVILEKDGNIKLEKELVISIPESHKTLHSPLLLEVMT